MMKKYAWLIALAALAAAAGTAFRREKPAPKGPCSEDSAKFCGSAKNLRDGIRCLRDNKTSLSPGCGSLLATALDTNEKMRNSCKNDAKKLCGDLKAKAFPCLLKNEVKLSQSCRSYMKEWKKIVAVIRPLQ